MTFISVTRFYISSSTLLKGAGVVYKGEYDSRLRVSRLFLDVVIGSRQAISFEDIALFATMSDG